MTTIAEEKARRETELKNAPNMVVMMRLKVIEAVQLAMEMKLLTDQGLSNSYHEMAKFYGKQRAILRGLTAGDVMQFNLPDGASWNQDPAFTFPSTDEFGFQFFDTSGTQAEIDDASQYYLTKKAETNVLSTMEEDSNAFVAPILLKDQQQNIVTWGATVFSMNLSQPLQAGTVKISLNGDQVAQDDGSGNITGSDITGTIDYQTRLVNLTLTDPVSQNELLYVIYDTDPAPAPEPDPVIRNKHDRIDVISQSTDYQCTLRKKVVPGTLKIQIDAVEAAMDDGVGNITGATITGTIDYQTQVLKLNFTNPDDRIKLITLVHDSIINEATFDESYSKVDFTLSTKEYLPGQTLKLIHMAAGELDQRPVLATSTLLRRKTDHQVIGTIKIICEGLETNTSWNHLSGDPGETTTLSHAEFKSLLGFLDMDLINPENNNDLQNSANSYLSSSGRKVGDSYPDIEKNPFWPCTDGEYQEAMIFKGHCVHKEDGVAKWSTHNDIKWQYGTRPAEYNPVSFSTKGETGQNNPESVINALQAIIDFLGSGDLIVPESKGSATAAGTTYQMVGSYVHAFEWEETVLGSGVYKMGPGSEFSCYYNDVQHVIDSHLNHLLVLPEDTNSPKQLEKLIQLGDVANSIEPGRQAADTQFFNQTVSYKNDLSTVLSYHNGFSPLDDKYNTSSMDTLKLVTGPGGYLSQVTSRLAEIDEILGNPAEAGSYSKIIYDACNYATNKDIGYLRDVIDKLNSIQDIYDMIGDKQQQYSMYQEISP